MSTLRLYNSLSRKKELFRPTNKHVGMYVCGITPYDVTHLGHAFTYTIYDALYRYLKFLEYRVTYVQNVTDIDDDILKKAKEEHKNWRALGEENTQTFLQDMSWLGNLQPDFYVRATDHIPEMLAIIQRLLKKGFAYEKEGSVYFAIAKDKDYGKLSGLSAKQMYATANERGNDPYDPNKRDPLDFVLWQRVPRSPKGEVGAEPSWNSPWGPGRPGWHIECSAMSTKYLGQPFSMHGGGGDLIFPHHASEIAQSTNAFKKPLAQYWLHTGMVSYQGEKMSKSLGNLVLIKNLKKVYGANTIRILFLSHHYRSVWECTEDDIRAAQKLNNALQKVWLLQSGQGKPLSFSKEQKMFFEAMNDDLNTPKALKILEALSAKASKNHQQSNITDAKAFLMEVFHTLGLTINP